MNIFKRARVIYILHRHAIHHDLWTTVYHKLPCLQSMSAVEKAHLRELSTLSLKIRETELSECVGRRNSVAFSGIFSVADVMECILWWKTLRYSTLRCLYSNSEYFY